ncbi:MAG: V-type ATP synthase subunit I [Bacillota bacterium]
MAVVKMKRASIICAVDMKERVLEKLQEHGCLQVSDVSGDISFQEKEVSEPPSCEELEVVRYVLRYLDSYGSEQKGLLETFIGSKQKISLDRMLEVVDSLDLASLHEMCLSDEIRLNAILQARQELLSRKEALLPWKEFPESLDILKHTRSCRVQPVSIPQGTLDAFTAKMTECGTPFYHYHVSDYNRRTYLVCICLGDGLESALSEVGGTVHNLHDIKGSPATALSDVEVALEALEKEEQEIRSRALSMMDKRKALRIVHDYYSFIQDRYNLSDRFGYTLKTAVLQGWIQADAADDMKRDLETLGAVELVLEDPAPGDSVPVVLKNHPLIEPFEVVTNLYGFPKYGEVDPTPLLAPFFFVFFGLALTDAGYGIMLSVLSYLALTRLTLVPSGKKIFRLLLLGGISTIIFGALTGSWFGDAFDLLPPYLGFLQTFRHSITLFDPISDPLLMLGVALALGIVQVLTGITIKMVINIREGRVVEGLAEQAPWLVFIPGLVLLGVSSQAMPDLAGVARWVSIAGALLVMAGASRNQRSVLLKPFVGLYGLYGVVGYLGDVLSYARLLALGLGTGVIGIVVNQIAMLARGIPLLGIVLTAVIMAGGHAFNLVINTLGSFVHSGRLQFVEFFTKFFEGGGKAFKPLKRDGKFTILEG